MKNNKRANTLIFLVLFSVLLFFIVLILFFLLDKRNNVVRTNNNNEIVTQTQSDQIKADDLKIKLINYTFYKIDDLKINFIIARIRFENLKKHPLSLNDVITTDNYKLSDTKDEILKLEKAGYNLKAKKLVSKIENENDIFEGDFYIPVKTIDEKFGIIINKKSIKFDLSSYHDGKDLRNVSEREISDGINYKIKVYDAINISSDMMYCDGEEYNIASTLQVYALMVEIESIGQKDLTLESANFYSETTKDNIPALDGRYSSMRYDNIIGKKVSNNAKGTIFVEAYNPNGDNIIYRGKLSLKFDSLENEIVVDVNLNKEEN